MTFKDAKKRAGRSCFPRSGKRQAFDTQSTISRGLCPRDRVRVGSGKTSTQDGICL